MKYLVHVQAPRSKWLQLPGFGLTSTGHELTIEAATPEEAGARGLAESMYPDGKVMSVRLRYLWRITLRRKDDRRRRETFVVSSADDLTDERMAARWARRALDADGKTGGRFGYPPEVVKVERGAPA